jgi:thiosulfate/3-mercaptopyruvate sulfurtransferase
MPEQDTKNRYLVDGAWLQDHLDDPELRILDCTVYLPNYFEESAQEKVEIVPGLQDYTRAHIPGSVYVDLVGDLTDKSNKGFMFPMPSADQFASVMSRLGVAEGTRVVLYDRMVNIWAARVWWMLRAFGFTNAAILDGGWAKWTAEGRPTSAAPAAYPFGNFVARFQPDRIATKEEVRAAIDDESTCLVNALDPEEFSGRGPVRYGRPGHIPTSVNVSFLGVLNSETNAYLPLDAIRAQFASAGVLGKDRIITYCGGGIAACSDAFLLTLIGARNVAVYDGSMTEWAADPELPLEVA